MTEVIFEAAKDGSDRMRYVAGEDARQLLELRKASDDETVMRAIKERFRL